MLIAKLDRLARNVHFISGLMETGVPFVAADMPTATPFMLHIYAAMAEAEGIAIGTRTKAALAAAKARRSLMHLAVDYDAQASKLERKTDTHCM